MEKDLFSAYIQNLTKSTPQTRYEVPVQKSETVMEQSCSLDVLREISRKLDKLDDLGKTLEKAKSMESLEYVEHTVDADIAILHGKVVLPDQGVFRANIYIKDGKIVSIGQQMMHARKIVDASNCYVLPGIIDPHVHLGLFAPMQTELSTETKSAIMGGDHYHWLLFRGTAIPFHFFSRNNGTDTEVFLYGCHSASGDQYRRTKEGNAGLHCTFGCDIFQDLYEWYSWFDSGC